MPSYRCILTRAWSVEVEANSKEEAARLTEFFIGDPDDASTEDERRKFNFKFGEIEMRINDVMEVEEIEFF